MSSSYCDECKSPDGAVKIKAFGQPIAEGYHVGRMKSVCVCDSIIINSIYY